MQDDCGLHRQDGVYYTGVRQMQTNRNKDGCFKERRDSKVAPQQVGGELHSRTGVGQMIPLRVYWKPPLPDWYYAPRGCTVDSTSTIYSRKSCLK